ncbi:MAG: hypothetical protein GY827_08340 [Cytophagales bacterium]|nr:hypothetical protein [Cytophagales bacterium]
MLTYTNRKGETFCVEKKESKSGSGYTYHVILFDESSKEKALIDALSPHYELYERPFDARVIIRRKFASTITPEEYDLVVDVLQALDLPELFIVELLPDGLLLYLSTLTKEDKQSIQDTNLFHRAQWYHEKIKLIKEGEVYKVQRYSNLLKHTGWITMESGSDLKPLLDKFLPHINQDTLLNFWEEETAQ